MNLRTRSALVGIAAVALSAAAAQAVTLPFFQITANGSVDVSNQLVLEVTDLGGGTISFDLSNAGPLSSVITMFNIQDEDGLFSDMTAVINGAGVDFSEDDPAGNLPGGNSVSFVSDWGSTANPPPASNGVNENEEVELRFSLADGLDWSDVLDSLGSGALRAGVHVQSIDQPGGGDQSESYVSNPPVPTPGALALAAVGMLGTIRRRR